MHRIDFFNPAQDKAVKRLVRSGHYTNSFAEAPGSRCISKLAWLCFTAFKMPSSFSRLTDQPKI
jgi:hypothetical protein